MIIVGSDDGLQPLPLERGERWRGEEGESSEGSGETDTSAISGGRGNDK